MSALIWGALWRWATQTLIGQIVAAVVIGALALGAWTWRVSSQAAAAAERAAMERVLKATAEESARRGRELDIARKNAERRDDALAALQIALASKLGAVDEASKTDDRRVCLDAGGSLRLDGLRGRPARRGAGDAGRPAERPGGRALR
jgi:hypothetical protein